MLESILTWPLAAGCAAGAAALYLLLTTRRRVALAAGIASACLALGALALHVIAPAAWWPEPATASPASSPLFVLFGLSSVASAGMTVTARDASQSAAWFAAAAICIACLFVSHDAWLPAAALPIIAGGAAALLLKLTPGGLGEVFSMLRFSGEADSAPTAPQDGPAPNGLHTAAIEPVLVCAAAGLLAFLLMGSVHHALAAPTAGDVDRLRSAVARRAAAFESRRADDDAVPRDSLLADHAVAMSISGALLLAALLTARAMTSAGRASSYAPALSPPSETLP